MRNQYYKISGRRVLTNTTLMPEIRRKKLELRIMQAG